MKPAGPGIWNLSFQIAVLDGELGWNRMMLLWMEQMINRN